MGEDSYSSRTMRMLINVEEVGNVSDNNAMYLIMEMRSAC